MRQPRQEQGIMFSSCLDVFVKVYVLRFEQKVALLDPMHKMHCEEGCGKSVMKLGKCCRWSLLLPFRIMREFQWRSEVKAEKKWRPGEIHVLCCRGVHD